MRQVDMDEHRRHETPPLVIRRIDQVVELCAVRLQHCSGNVCHIDCDVIPLDSHISRKMKKLAIRKMIVNL
jgi:hypothetical protein